MKVTYTYSATEAAQALRDMHRSETSNPVEVIVETPSASLDIMPANTYNMEMLTKLLQCFVRNQGSGKIPIIKSVREVTRWGLGEAKDFVETVLR